MRTAVGQQRAMVGLGQFQPLEHRQLRLACVGVRLLVSSLGRGGSDESRGLESLELHRVRACRVRGVHQLARKIERAVVVHAGLGDDEARFAGANAAT